MSIRWSHDADAVVALAAESSRPTHAASRPVDACKVLAAMTALSRTCDAPCAMMAPQGTA